MSKLLLFSIIGIFSINFSLAHADCDGFYKAAIFSKKSKKDKNEQVVGEALAGTATVTATGEALLGISELSGVASVASVAMPVYVYFDIYHNRGRTRLDEARWILKESHGSKGIYAKWTYHEAAEVDMPTEDVDLIGHWDLKKLSKVVAKNKEVQNKVPGITRENVKQRVADLDDQNVFCPDPKYLATKNGILLAVYQSYGATQTAEKLERKLKITPKN